MGVFDDLGRVIGRAFSFILRLPRTFAIVFVELTGGEIKGKSPYYADFPRGPMPKDTVPWPASVIAQGLAASFKYDEFGPETVVKKAVTAIGPESPPWKKEMIDAAQAYMKPLKELAEVKTEELAGAKSPLTPEEAFTAWTAWFGTAIASIVTGLAAGICAEAATLGQIESVLSAAWNTLHSLGIAGGVSRGFGIYLDRSMFQQLTYYYNQTFQPEIPRTMDLVTMEVREVWRPDFRPELLKPPPTDEFYKWMSMQGFSRFHADSYWAMHWVLPSVGQGYAMYHRLPEFKLEDLKRLMTRLDILPYYHDHLIKIAYRLIPRVDLRRAWEANIPGFEDLTPHYEKLGYSPEDAEAEAKLQTRVALTAEIGDLERETELSFRRGYSLIDQAEAELDALAFHPTRVKSRIQYYEIRAEREHKDALVDLYVDAYKKDIIPTEEELRDRLLEVIVRPEVIDRTVEEAQVAKFRKSAVTKETDEEKAAKKVQTLRQAMAIQEYRRYVIDKDELVEDLIDADVHPDLAAARADYEELKRPIKKPSPEEIAEEKEQRALRKLEERIAVEKFRKRVISAEELVDRLVDLGESEALAVAVTQLEILRMMPKPKVAS